MLSKYGAKIYHLRIRFALFRNTPKLRYGVKLHKPIDKIKSIVFYFIYSNYSNNKYYFHNSFKQTFPTFIETLFQQNVFICYFFFAKK